MIVSYLWIARNLHLTPRRACAANAGTTSRCQDVGECLPGSLAVLRPTGNDRNINCHKLQAGGKRDWRSKKTREEKESVTFPNRHAPGVCCISSPAMCTTDVNVASVIAFFVSFVARKWRWQTWFATPHWSAEPARNKSWLRLLLLPPSSLSVPLSLLILSSFYLFLLTFPYVFLSSSFFPPHPSTPPPYPHYPPSFSPTLCFPCFSLLSSFILHFYFAGHYF